MKKLVLVAALGAAVAMSSLAFSGAAFAAPPKTHHAKTPATATKPAASKEESTSGVVSSYAADTRQLTLNTGGKFTLGPSVMATSYKAGDKVKVGWKMEKGARIADSVTMSN